MASLTGITPRIWLPTFIEDVQTYSAKIISGEISAVPDLIRIIKKILSVLQSDAEIDLTQLRVITDCLGSLVKVLLKQHDQLQKRHDELQESHDKLHERHVKLQESHDELQESHDELQVSVQELDEKVKELEDLEEVLLVGQIALKVEKVFIGEILYGTNVTKTRYLTIGQLKYALSDHGWDPLQSESIFKSQEEVLKAKENWERLQTTFQPDYELYGAIKSLKWHRNNKAHPGMSVTQARERLANCSDHDMIYRLLDILEKAKVQNIET